MDEVVDEVVDEVAAEAPILTVAIISSRSRNSRMFVPDVMGQGMRLPNIVILMLSVSMVTISAIHPLHARLRKIRSITCTTTMRATGMMSAH